MSTPRPATRWCVAELVPGSRQWALNTAFMGLARAPLLRRYRDAVSEAGPPWPVDYKAVKVRILPVETSGWTP